MVLCCEESGAGRARRGARILAWLDEAAVREQAGKAEEDADRWGERSSVLLSQDDQTRRHILKLWKAPYQRSEGANTDGTAGHGYIARPK